MYSFFWCHLCATKFAVECNIEYHLVGEVASYVGQRLPAHLGLDILRGWGGVNFETLGVIDEVIAAELLVYILVPPSKLVFAGFTEKTRDVVTARHGDDPQPVTELSKAGVGLSSSHRPHHREDVLEDVLVELKI